MEDEWRPHLLFIMQFMKSYYNKSYNLVFCIIHASAKLNYWKLVEIHPFDNNYFPDRLRIYSKMQMHSSVWSTLCPPRLLETCTYYSFLINSVEIVDYQSFFPDLQQVACEVEVLQGGREMFGWLTAFFIFCWKRKFPQIKIEFIHTRKTWHEVDISALKNGTCEMFSL